ncbi:hypothetical protein ACI4BE_27560, partial [Klebsiella pneumoniae]|uniref:hypothetical protein n=1 Tax=Klebsiella pneumoniae TaxID=573 RepID=UPI003852B1CB
LDSQLAIPAGRKILRDGPSGPATLFAARDAVLPAHLAETQVRRVGRGPDGGVSLRLVLRAMAVVGMPRLVGDGGPSPARAFLDAGLVDEVVLFRGR